jgi:hypothetical protein
MGRNRKRMTDKCTSNVRAVETAGEPNAPNMSQRAVMQVLSSDEWKVAAHLPVPAGEVLLKRIHEYGWIETRGEKYKTAIKLTQAGLEAMRSVLKQGK